MNQRLTFTAAAVALAASAAAFRAWHPAPPALAIAPGESPANPAAARSSPPRNAPLEGGPAPDVSARPERAVVYVAGEVLRPGVYALPASARAVDALHAAGGPAGDADLVAVNLAEPLVDGEEIVVRPKGASVSLGSSVAAGPARTGRGHRSARGSRRRRGSRSRKAPPGEAVDLNRADAVALEELPGVGPALAERIVAFRELNGPFASLDDLLDVNGMSESRLQELAPYAVVR